MSESTLTTSRIISFPREKILMAWSTPELLASWWGPDGFSNEFEIFDFTLDGEWKFTMIGPDGVRYPNESRWREISDFHILLEHMNGPHYFLKVSFEKRGEETLVTWSQTFDSARVLEGLRKIITPANEQNLNRLEKCLEKMQ